MPKYDVRLCPSCGKHSVRAFSKCAGCSTSLAQEPVVTVRETDSLFVKRLIGVGGDTVEIRDNVLYLNGAQEERAYGQYVPWSTRITEQHQYGPAKIPLDSVFVLGDNWDNLRDSRYYGPIPKASIVGKVWIRK